MLHTRRAITLHHRKRTLHFAASLCAAFLCIALAGSAALGHPLGNFTINHFSRIEIDGERIRVRYVVDMAEISTLQELQQADTDGDGSPSSAELNAYLERVAPQYAEQLRLTVDGTRIPLSTVAQRIAAVPRDGGLLTLRIECDFAGEVTAGAGGSRRLRFEDANHPDRIGWHEIAVVPSAGTSVFNSNAYSDSFTDELKAYPEDLMIAPLDERNAELSFINGAVPAGVAAQPARRIPSSVKMRDWSGSASDGAPAIGSTLRGGEGGSRPAAAQSSDRLAALIAVPELTPMIALFGLLIACVLGALHAFSPGHGKTVVGAYLVGSRGTARHAAFLGLTVTITHTLGVFALGLVTLFASQYIVPETLLPILSFVSGAIVVTIGLSLFTSRLRGAFKRPAHEHSHGSHSHTSESHTHTGHDAAHEHAGGHSHTHEGHAHAHNGDNALVHSHDGGTEHSHLPPGADGSPVTWRSLLALGISGGLLPCPSALVVLLSAISLHRVGYGMFLVVAFSIGLAATLTAIGLMFVYAGRWMKRPAGAFGDRLVRVLPIGSAFVIACVGAAICYEALGQGGFNLSAFLGKVVLETRASFAGDAPSFVSASALAVLGLGLVFGLKHATEVDHVIAVSTIVSEHRKLSRAALVGGLWGVGHTASLMIVGIVVLLLRVAIPERVANWLEFCVALMIIGLGAHAFLRALRRRSDIHLHKHQHDGDDVAHAHVHFHEPGAEPHDNAHGEHSHAATTHSHAISRIGLKPLLVGAMHGLAGSAALTLLVLTQINSAAIGLLYLTIFGVGSIFGMLIMSGLIGLPFALSARRFNGIHYGLQALAGAVSIAFGFWYAYETGITTGILATIL
ncbi:MAG TPA: sulfite exporter TauE/SafE family protein [Pyrinomonadaceae bacterium]|nr:sulfite exporter TauE/SafE family protein [Pyrinomonadaceae bacterium]